MFCYFLQITSVLVMTQLSTELAEQDGNRGTVSILLGLDIDEFTSQDKTQQGTNKNFSLKSFVLFELALLGG